MATQKPSTVPMEWQGDRLLLLDQRLLPGKENYLVCTSYQEVADAISVLAVRGAPAIGLAAAYGLVLAAQQAPPDEDKVAFLAQAAGNLEGTRPTAVNLAWACRRMLAVAGDAGKKGEGLVSRLLEEAHAIAEEDLAMNRAMGEHGQKLLIEGSRVLTHCNAGALATSGWGTALGVIRAAHAQGRNIEVYACETRPLLQGARLTTWELMQDGIPVTLITDGMAGHLMRQRRVDAVIVGADRIAANGDVANKIGTYGLAVLAHAHGIPFYVAAPTSTIDMSISHGDEIVIEERHADEVRHVGPLVVAPAGVGVYNPAFDVTPAEYISALITDRGVLTRPLEPKMKEFFLP